VDEREGGGSRDCCDQTTLLWITENGTARHNGRRRRRVQETIDIKQADDMLAFTPRVPVRRDIRNEEL